MKISINAPSYKRPKGVKTLRYIPFCKIWVDEGEAEAYREGNPGANIIACPKGVQGNLCRVRNYILEQEFQSGADVVLLIDDDLSAIERFEVQDGFGYAKHRLETDEILPFLEKYSRMAQELGAKFWGLNCNPDAMSYRHYTPFSTNSYIGGPFQCFLRGNMCRYDEDLPLKEDYDMTLQQLNIERVVLRLNSYHYYCEQSSQPGGCAAIRNREREAEQFNKLREKWGGANCPTGQKQQGEDEQTKGLGRLQPDNKSTDKRGLMS